jgi:two-component system, NtrC family, response regulator HydG
VNTKLKILIVDDNEDFCKNMADIMELKKYKVNMAYSGIQAIDMVGKNHYDLIIMDIKMPVMDGVEAFRKIKAISPETIVIMITAFAVEDLIKDALREGAFAALKKPVDFDNLFHIISDAVGEGTMVLIVDDDENLCENMKDILETRGYQVSVAYDSNSAIQKTRENNYDILLIDMKLPPLNGLETYLSIKDIRPKLVAIVITAYTDDMKDSINNILRKGAYTCLEKPVNMNKLISLLKQIEKGKTDD